MGGCRTPSRARRGIDEGDAVDGTHLTFEQQPDLIAWLSEIGGAEADPIPLEPEALAGFVCAVSPA